MTAPPLREPPYRPLSKPGYSTTPQESGLNSLDRRGDLGQVATPDRRRGLSATTTGQTHSSPVEVFHPVVIPAHAEKAKQEPLPLER